MKPVAFLAVSVWVLAFAGSSAVAFAVTPGQSQNLPKTNKLSQSSDVTSLSPMTTPVGDSYISDSTTSFSKPSSKVYQFNLKGKWGVKFDVNQPETTPSGFNDIDAGAFYKLTPSLRVSGSLGFGVKSDPLKPAQAAAQNDKKQPRVRLETTFKF